MKRIYTPSQCHILTIAADHIIATSPSFNPNGPHISASEALAPTRRSSSEFDSPYDE